MNVDEGNLNETDSEKGIKQEAQSDYKPDHGSSFVPGAGPEHLAPKSLDHFKRGYEERAAQRDKEFYTVGGGATSTGQNAEDQDAQVREPTPPPAPQPPPRRTYGRGGSTGSGNFGNNGSAPSGYGNDFDNEDDQFVANHDTYDNNLFDDENYPVAPHGGGRSGRDGMRDIGSSNNGTGFGGRGGRGGSGNRRYMDDPWGYRDRPTVLQGLDINALMDRLADLSHEGNPDKIFAELDRVREEYKQIFDTGKAMTALISVAARRKQIYLGHAVWDWMDRAKLQKNTFHYNSMISVAEKAKNYQHALDLLHQMSVRNIPKNEVT
jgi:pentatricopeptide repeat protein